MDQSSKIKVGIGIMVYRNGQVLLGKRQGSHGAGEYASPGGSMEFGESFAESAMRECLEATEMRIANISFRFLSNLRSYTGKHYVHIQLDADWESGEPRVMEPEKCEYWDWYSLDDLPSPMFKTYDLYLESLETGRNYFDQ